MTDSASPPLTPFSGARAVDEPLFRALLDAEVHKAQRLRYCISIVCIAVDAALADLPASVLEFFRRQLRATDVVTTWASTSLAVLLVDAEVSDIPAVMRRITASLTPESWSAGAVSYPHTARAADDMLSEATNLLEQALHDPAKHLYLA